MTNKYKLHSEKLTTVDAFNILIIEIPEDEIEDRLAPFSKEDGVINKSLFEDWLITNCVANMNQLLYSLNKQIDVRPDLMKIRNEMVEIILKFNKKLNPEHLILNSNNVIKVKGSGKLNSGDRILAEIKYWNMIFDEPSNKEGAKSESNETKKEDDIDSLKFDMVQKWWSRLGQYIKIKQFNAEDVKVLLAKRFFHDKRSFITFILSICLEDFEALFVQLDSMGIPARVTPPVLLQEIYDLCVAVNPFLSFDNIREMMEEDASEDDDDNKQQNSKPGAAHNTIGGYLKEKKATKRKFKDVPKKDLLMLGKNMKVFLVGQDEAVDSLVNAIQRASIGLKDPNKPIGSFLFAGQTGCGKSLTSKILANELIKGRDNIITIDCSEYSADHEYSKLIGSPAGYIGHEHGGMLTNAIAKNPFSVVVFDEVEKASNKVHELLLQILDEGRLTDGKGKTVYFKESVIILTSNVGVQEVEDIKKTIGFGEVAKITEAKRRGALDRALKKKFKPEFLNRIDSIISFNSLTKQDYMRIIDIELYKLNDNLKTNDTEYKNIVLKFDKKVKEMIYKKGINVEYGARPLKRAIEIYIATPLAKRLLEDDAVDKDSIINVSAIKGKISFEVEKKLDKPPFYITDDYQNQMVMGEGV